MFKFDTKIFLSQISTKSADEAQNKNELFGQGAYLTLNTNKDHSWKK